MSEATQTETDDAQIDERPAAIRVVDRSDYADVVDFDTRTEKVVVSVQDDTKIARLNGNLNEWFLSNADWENHTLTFRTNRHDD